MLISSQLGRAWANIYAVDGIAQQPGAEGGDSRSTVALVRIHGIAVHLRASDQLVYSVCESIRLNTRNNRAFTGGGVD